MYLFLFYLFVILGLINFIHIGLYIGGANLYDMRAFRRKPARIRGKQPLVTIVVPAHNEELVITRCLDSIRRNTYRKVQVIVHNDRSTDKTASLVNTFKRQYPYMDIRLVNRRKQVGKGGGLNYCIKHHAAGSLIMTLDADCVLDKRAIKKAVDYFADENVIGVAANVRIMDSPSILSLLQKFEHMIGYRAKKFYTLTNSEFIVGGVASTYRSEIIKQVKYYDTDTETEDIGLSMKIIANSDRNKRIIYAADVVAMTEGVESFRGLLKQRYRWKMGMIQNLLKYRSLFGRVGKQYNHSLTLYRIPMAFLSELMLIAQPFVLGYIAFLSIRYQTFGLFVGAYMTITLYILWTIWPDEHSPLKHKLSLTFYAPIMYFVFYIMDLVQIAAIFRCLINPKKMLRKQAYNGAWVSPTRKGIQQPSAS